MPAAKLPSVSIVFMVRATSTPFRSTMYVIRPLSSELASHMSLTEFAVVPIECRYPGTVGATVSTAGSDDVRTCTVVLAADALPEGSTARTEYS